MAHVIQPQNFTTWIFDRPALTEHPWSNALSDLERDKDIGRRALCSNLRMDHRIEKSREQSMLNAPFFGGHPTGEVLLSQWKEYYQSALCRQSKAVSEEQLPVYLKPYNENNRLTNKTPEFDQLIHVGSLNRILWRLANAECGSSSAFAMDFWLTTQCSLPGRKRDGGDWNRINFNKSIDELVGELLIQGKDVIKKMTGLLCDALGPNQPPWWACFAEDVNTSVQSKDWAALCKTLGMGYLRENEWILIWRYEVGDAGPLFRPTLVEANDTPYHYPSPPSSRYGVTMPLSLNLPNCREVIHPPLSSPEAGEACTGEIGKIQGFSSEDHYHHNNIPHYRRVHFKRLEQEFTNMKDQDWFERHKRLL